MKTQIFKKRIQATLLALLISSSMSTLSHAQPVDQVIAVVGDSAILKSDLDLSIAEAEQRAKLQNKAIPSYHQLAVQMLDQLILQNAQLEQVKRFGLQVNEQELNDAVMRIARQSGESNLMNYQQKLDAMAPGTYEILRNRVAQQLLIQQLSQQQVMSRIRISDQDIDNFLKSPEGQAVTGNQVQVIHLRISGTAPAAELKQTATQVRAALNQSNDIQAIQNQFKTANITVEGNDMGLRSISSMPAELAARVSSLKTNQTTDLIQVQDGIHILKLLDRKQSAQQVLVPQFKTQHILIKTSEVVTPENAKQMIDSIYNRLQAGSDFNTLAATYSNDPGSAADGGNLGWVSPGMMVPEFDQIMQDIPVGQISQPFQTQFGWHILRVNEQRQQDMTRENQRNMARQVLGERQFDSEVDSWLRELRANTYIEIRDPSLDPKKQNGQAQ
ncbi:peptidylprolyl isomerase [Acinetobacter larvae]|uniref:Chaperone SurA n=1 Tax=Acinetobacter larvae TaxID=1789224 RepID=A0A1B2LYD2_9GAMM|nr:peptidylprolyl isomerase [Acinetobacter larvae]AOA57950.1 peptidylprolyl isomerase [Acinetobacter larvae]